MINPNKLVIKRINYSEYPVLSNFGTELEGVINNLASADVDVYLGMNTEVCIHTTVSLNDFPHWDEVREFIAEKATKFIVENMR